MPFPSHNQWLYKFIKSQPLLTELLTLFTDKGIKALKGKSSGTDHFTVQARSVGGGLDGFNQTPYHPKPENGAYK